MIHLLPGAGTYTPISVTPWQWFTSLLMPWCVLAAAFAAFYARMVRGNLIDMMGEDYIRTARAKGLSERRVVSRHGLRAALTPVVTMAGLDIGILLGGAILTETVFNIPGIGRYAYDSIINSDLPAIQGTVLFGAFFIIAANIFVDIALRVPRPAGALLMALLEIRDLRVRFATRDGVVNAVDGVSLEVDRGRTLGIVGESGSGKSVTALTVMGLRASRTRRSREPCCSTGSTCSSSPPDDLRRVRGKRVAMIFQDPLSSLHPLYKVGWQIVEAHPGARACLREGRARARARGAHGGRDPERRRPALELPARALGRDAAARDDRDGARPRPRDPDRRRADDRARRHRPGADPRSRPRAPGRATGPRSSSSPTTSA